MDLSDIIDKDEFTTGEMAELNLSTKRALRLYHERGLLTPNEVNDQTGYRYYSIDQCSTVDMIQHLEFVGFSLDEIAELNKNRDLETLNARLMERYEDLEREYREIADRIRNVRDLMDRCETCVRSPIKNQIMLEWLPERRIVLFDNPDPDSLDNPDGVEALRNWERTTRVIKHRMVEQGISLTYFRNVGCIVRQADLAPDKLRLTRSYVFVDEDYHNDRAEIGTRPAGQYLTMYSSTTLAPDGSLGEFYELRRMLEYADRKGFEVCGDYFGESIADTPVFLFEGRECLLKLNVPVRRKSADGSDPALSA